jgi:hypothetical protein
MKTLNQNDISEICGYSGIHISDSMLGVGRELSFCDTLCRIIVVHFIESDFPSHVQEVIASILQQNTQWILLNRHGELQAKEFNKDDVASILEFLIGIYPKVQREGDDLYLFGKNGKLLVLYDHNLFSDGMTIYLTEIELTNTLLTQFNALGVELELFSGEQGVVRRYHLSIPIASG